MSAPVNLWMSDPDAHAARQDRLYDDTEGIDPPPALPHTPRERTAEDGRIRGWLRWRFGSPEVAEIYDDGVRGGEAGAA